MTSTLIAAIFTSTLAGRTVLNAMPVVIGVLCLLAIAYRYYSAFLAAKAAALDDSRATPAHRLYDGQNYHPTNKWVLFGHHFAAISGAGPLIGPVLAMQYGYLPGLLWLVIGVCLGGAVQDMLVLAASVRHDGKSLAVIARQELGRGASIVVSAAILFIVIIALAGLGIVVVKALGGETLAIAPKTRITLPAGTALTEDAEQSTSDAVAYKFPEKCQIQFPGAKQSERSEAFVLQVPRASALPLDQREILVPAGTKQLFPGSSWGTFTIACTIPIALLVGLYMYRIRKGKVLEASLIGAALTIGATILGAAIPGSPLEKYFALSRGGILWAMMIYGFVASILPVWLLLCPRDYLSSFLKIGTIILLVVGVIIANPSLKHPPINEHFLESGPTFRYGAIFPFVFICVMCGAISGFHSLVSSGTTPKMIDRESHIRPIGYGAMLIESLVGVVALIAAASLQPRLYFEINENPTDTTYQEKLEQLYREVEGTPAARDPAHQVAVREPHQLPVGQTTLAQVEKDVGESLRGRTGGAVTLAVGIALIFTDAMHSLGLVINDLIKYWYHFAIMFEALFILTTIDTGTRIARFLVQESLGEVYEPFRRTDWLPGAALATAMVTSGWGVLIATGSIDTIWPMFGIANQLLAVIALCLVTTWLVNSGRGRYAWVTVLPMCFIITTTMTAGTQMIAGPFVKMLNDGRVLMGVLNIGFTVFVMTCVATLLLIALARWVTVWAKGEPAA